MHALLELLRDYWWALPLAFCFYHCVFVGCRRQGGLCCEKGRPVR